MALNYTVYQYDGSRNAVVMTDMEGKQLVIDCDRAEEQVVFDGKQVIIRTCHAPTFSDTIFSKPERN